MVPQVLAHIDASPARSATKLVAIDGRGGSGKSRLAQSLMAIDSSVKLLPVDHFPCLQEEYPFHGSGVQTRISEERLLLTLLRLTDNVPAFYRQTYWVEGEGLGPARRIEPGGIVLIEGSYSLLPSFRAFLDYSIWIECDYEQALTRAVTREVRNEAEFTRWVAGHAAAQESYIAAHRPAEFADLVLNVDSEGDLSLDPCGHGHEE